MIIPHSDKPSFSIKTPIILFQGFAVAAALALILGINFVGSYISMSEKAAEVEALREVKREQREKIDYFAQETKNLNKKVEELSRTADKVREILDMEDGETFEEVKDEDREWHSKLDGLEQESTMDAQNYKGGYSSSGHEKSSQASLHAWLSEISGDKAPFNTSTTADRADSTLRQLYAELPDKRVDLDELKEAAIEKEERKKHTPSEWPLEGRITSGFGPRRNPATGVSEFHEGIDIAGDHGESIYAPANGQVVYKDYRGGYGNLLIIDHGYGYRTHYAHLAEFTVEKGEQVERGDHIAKVGTTGFSTGPHLHYEIHVNDEPIDPKEFLD